MAKELQQKAKKNGESIGTRLNRGYQIVIVMMIISGIVSIICTKVWRTLWRESM